MTESEKRKYKGRSVLTTWDIAAEVFGDDSRDNFRKVRGAFMDNYEEFIEGVDYFSVGRAFIVEQLNISIDRALNRIMSFQMFTRAGVEKILELLGLSELNEGFDDLFADDDPSEYETITPSLVVAQKKPIEPVIVNQDLPEDHRTLSDSILSLINYITTAKALFDDRLGSAQVGSVMYNANNATLQVITSIISIPESDKKVIQVVNLEYKEEVGLWELGDKESIATFSKRNIGVSTMLSEHGVDFLLGLKDEAKTASVVNTILELTELFEQLRGLKEEINNKINGICDSINP